METWIARESSPWNRAGRRRRSWGSLLVSSPSYSNASHIYSPLQSPDSHKDSTSAPPKLGAGPSHWLPSWPRDQRSLKQGVEITYDSHIYSTRTVIRSPPQLHQNLEQAHLTCSHPGSVSAWERGCVNTHRHKYLSSIITGGLLGDLPILNNHGRFIRRSPYLIFEGQICLLHC